MWCNKKKPPLTFLQLTQTILDEIIAFHPYVQSTNSVNFWEIDKNTFDIKIDDPNFYIAKCTLQQAILLNATQIPVLTILVQSEQDRQQMLLRVSTLLAKFHDLLPCIFQIKIQPSLSESIPISTISTHSKILEILLKQAPLIPSATVQAIKRINGELEKAPESLPADSANIHKVDNLYLKFCLAFLLYL